MFEEKAKPIESRQALNDVYDAEHKLREVYNRLHNVAYGRNIAWTEEDLKYAKACIRDMVESMNLIHLELVNLAEKEPCK